MCISYLLLLQMIAQHKMSYSRKKKSLSFGDLEEKNNFFRASHLFALVKMH